MGKQVLYMDYSTGRSLQIFLTYLISEGKINDEMYYYLFGDDSLSNDEKQAMLHRHFRGFYGMLSMLTLYDEIVVYPINEIQRLDEGLLDELGIHYSSTNEKSKSGIKRISKNKKAISAEEAANIVRAAKGAILSDFRQEKSYADYWINYDFDLSDSFDYYLERNYHLSVLPSSKPIKNISTLLEFDILGRGPQNLLKTGEYDFMDYLDSTFSSLAKSMYDRRGTFYSSLFYKDSWSNINMEDLDKMDDLVFAADFASGMGVIPHPETIEEVVSWRKHANMKSFRSVFSDWVSVLRNGNLDMACKMKMDVRRANEQLIKLDKYEKLNKNALVAIIKTGISKIPAIDILATTTDFLTPYIADYIQSKNGWVNLPAFNPNCSLLHTLRQRNKD